MPYNNNNNNNNNSNNSSNNNNINNNNNNNNNNNFIYPGKDRSVDQNIDWLVLIGDQYKKHQKSQKRITWYRIFNHKSKNSLRVQYNKIPSWIKSLNFLFEIICGASRSTAHGKTVPKLWHCHHKWLIPHGNFCETLWDAQKNSQVVILP